MFFSPGTKTDFRVVGFEKWRPGVFLLLLTIYLPALKVVHRMVRVWHGDNAAPGWRHLVKGGMEEVLPPDRRGDGPLSGVGLQGGRAPLGANLRAVTAKGYRYCLIQVHWYRFLFQRAPSFHRFKSFGLTGSLERGEGGDSAGLNSSNPCGGRPP